MQENYAEQQINEGICANSLMNESTAASLATELTITAEDLAILRLIRSQNVGAITYKHLLAKYKTALQALEELPHLAKRGGSRTIKVCSQTEAETELYAHQKLGCYVVTHRHALYPELLRHIYDAPPVLSVRGNLQLLQRINQQTHKILAIVGARNASMNALMLARQIAQDLSEHNWIIVSGLARGIDSAAHQPALKSGTAAIVAGGVDIIYPPENAALYHAINEHGVIISEAPLGTEPQPRLFPRRNRIIAGLSHGVLVVEATLRSGSLITAQCGLDQGREVMAVPGFPLDPRAQGTNYLLKNGATLIENSQDVINALSRVEAREATSASWQPEYLYVDSEYNSLTPDQLERYRQEILSLLGCGTVRIDDLAHNINVPMPWLLSMILELEIAGKIVRLDGQRIMAVVEVFE